VQKLQAPLWSEDGDGHGVRDLWLSILVRRNHLCCSGGLWT